MLVYMDLYGFIYIIYDIYGFMLILLIYSDLYVFIWIRIDSLNCIPLYFCTSDRIPQPVFTGARRKAPLHVSYECCALVSSWNSKCRGTWACFQKLHLHHKIENFSIHLPPSLILFFHIFSQIFGLFGPSINDSKKSISKASKFKLSTRTQEGFGVGRGSFCLRLHQLQRKLWDAVIDVFDKPLIGKEQYIVNWWPGAHTKAEKREQLELDIFFFWTLRKQDQQKQGVCMFFSIFCRFQELLGGKLTKDVTQ